MSYEEVIKLILTYVKSEGNTNTQFYGNILLLNERKNWDYPVFVLSPRIVTNIGYFRTCGFTAWYVNKLEKDRQQYIWYQSEGVELFTRINNMLSDNDQIYSVSSPISVFNEKFNDICAGAIADINITVKGEICY